MKNILCVFIFLSIASCKSEKKKSNLNSDLSEQNVDTILEANNPIQPIEYHAEFKYGLDSIPKLIYTNMKLTEEKGTVWISIIIDSIGNIAKTEIIRSDNEKLNSEALRLAKLIPNEWKPAEQGTLRTKIKSRYDFPIKFDRAVKILYAD